MAETEVTKDVVENPPKEVQEGAPAAEKAPAAAAPIDPEKAAIAAERKARKAAEKEAKKQKKKEKQGQGQGKKGQAQGGQKQGGGKGKGKGKGADKLADKVADMAVGDKVTFNAKKSGDFPTWYTQIMTAAEIVDQRYPVKGMPVFSPFGYFMHSKIMTLVEQEWDRLVRGREWREIAVDHMKAQFPLLIPETFLQKEKDHVAGFESEVFWVTKGGLKDLDVRLALRPTSETAMYYMFALWVRSFNDLPLKIQQTCSVFRHETKDTRPLIRAREIYWNEAHTCHATEKEALENLEEAWGGYMNVIRDTLGVHGMRLRRPEWDKFAGADHTDVLDTVMPCGRVLQTIGAHYLGQKFAKVFDIKFLNANNEFEHPFMTCYGVSTRVLAAALSVHGDDSGLVVPPAIAQYQVVIIPIIMKKKDQRPREVAEETRKMLRAAGIRCTVDGADKKPGEKFYYWEMKGVPIRLEIGPKDCDKEQVRVVRRDNKEKIDVKTVELVDFLKKTFETQTKEMCAKSLQHSLDVITECSTMEEVQAAIRSEKGGFARVPFCSMGKVGKEGDQIIHDKSDGGEVRGFVVGEAPPAEGVKCICHGDRQATVYGYVARAY